MKKALSLLVALSLLALSLTGCQNGGSLSSGASSQSSSSSQSEASHAGSIASLAVSSSSSSSESSNGQSSSSASSETSSSSRVFTPEEQEVVDIFLALEQNVRDLECFMQEGLIRPNGKDPITGSEIYDPSTWIEDEENGRLYAPFDPGFRCRDYHSLEELHALLDNTFAPGSNYDYYYQYLFGLIFREFNGELYFITGAGGGGPGGRWITDTMEIQERTETKITIFSKYYYFSFEPEEGILELEKWNGKWLLNDTYYHSPLNPPNIM